MIKLLATLALISLSVKCMAVEGQGSISFSYVSEGNGKVEVQNMDDVAIEIPGSVGLKVVVGDDHQNTVIPIRNYGISWISSFKPGFILPSGNKVKVDVSEYSYEGELMKYDRLIALVKSQGFEIIGYQIYEGGNEKTQLNDRFILSKKVR